MTVTDTDSGGLSANTTFTLTVQAAADYTVTTTGNAIVVTDITGGSDTLNISEPSAGNIQFSVSGRVFVVNGGANISGTSGVLSLTGITSITVNAAAGDDVINVGAFAGSVPSLTLHGGTGNDTVNFNGNIAFALNANLIVDLTSDAAPADADVIVLAGNTALTLSGTGAATLKCSQSITINSGALVQTANGNLTLEANQAATVSFAGRGIDNSGTLQSTGTGNVSVKGHGGNIGNSAGGIYNLGSIIGGTSGTLFVQGIGGAANGNNANGLYVPGFITTTGADIQIDARGGGTAATSDDYGLFIQNGTISAGGTGSVTITTTENLNAAPAFFFNGGSIAAGGTITVITNSFDLSPGTINAGTNTVTIHPRTNATAIDLGSTASSHSGPLNLSNGELAAITAGALAIGDANTGALTVSAAINSNKILSLTGSSIASTGGSLATTAASITLNSSGGIGTSGNRIAFADNTSIAQQNVIVGSVTQPSSVFIDGLGSLTLGTISCGTSNGSIDVTARTNLVVAANATINCGTSTLSLGADLTAAGAGDDGVGTLTVSAGALVDGAALTLRGADVDIAATASVGDTISTTSLTIRPSIESRPTSLGGTNSQVAGINLTAAELTRVATTSAGTLTIGDNTTTGTITLDGTVTLASQMNVALASGSTQFNTGTLNTAGGNLALAPGAAANTFTPASTGTDANMGANGTLSFPSGGKLAIAINGTAPDTQYQQLRIVGKLDLTGAGALTLSGSYTPAFGDSFTLVDNDGSDAITGTFPGLAEGATFPFNGKTVKISYVGGSGNDIVLSVARIPIIL